MKKMLFFSLLLLFAFSADAQFFGKRKLKASQVHISDSLKVGSIAIAEISSDSSLVSASDYRIPTEKAVKGYVDNHSGVGGGNAYNITPQLLSHRVLLDSAKNIGGYSVTMFQGDSRINGGNRGITQFVKKMSNRVEYGGAGYVSLARGAEPPTGFTITHVGLLNEDVADNLGGLDLSDAHATTGDSIVITSISGLSRYFGDLYKYTKLRLHYKANTTGVVEIRVDDTLVGTANTASTAFFDVVGFADISHRLSLTVASGDLEFYGVELLRDAGFVVHKIGRNGANTVNYAASQNYSTLLANLLAKPDIIITALGSNDAGTAPVLYGTNLQAIIANNLAGAPLADIVLETAPDRGDFAYSVAENLANIIRELGESNNYPIIDMFNHFGDWIGANAVGLYSDVVHESIVGGDFRASIWVDFLDVVSSNTHNNVIIDGVIIMNNPQQNVIVGGGSEVGWTVAQRVAAVGYGAGQFAEGDDLTALGHKAGQSVGNKARGTVIGAKSGDDLDGPGNTCVGMESGENLIGADNTVLGDAAGQNGQLSSSFLGGHEAGQGATGTNNIFIGDGSGQLTDGNRNTFFGTESGRFFDGDDAFFGGYWVGRQSTGSRPIMLGGQFGSNYTGRFNSGNDVIVLGVGSCANNTFDNVFIVGKNISPTKDNQIIFHGGYSEFKIGAQIYDVGTTPVSGQIMVHDGTEFTPQTIDLLENLPEYADEIAAAAAEPSGTWVSLPWTFGTITGRIAFELP